MGGDLSRRALEALALDEYKLGHLTTAELRRLLGFAAFKSMRISRPHVRAGDLKAVPLSEPADRSEAGKQPEPGILVHEITGGAGSHGVDSQIWPQTRAHSRRARLPTAT